MSVAKTIEVSATSPESFEDAIKQGVARTAKSVDGIQDVWIKEQKCGVQNNQIAEYRVHMMVTFVVND